jgi:hypothetical protein
MDYAFPFHTQDEKSLGMTLREWYAGCALQGLLASFETNALDTASDTDANIATRCFALADQMIAAGGRK